MGSPKEIIIHGRGGHGKVVADAWTGPYRFTDDSDGTCPGPGTLYICAIGDNRTRQKVGGTANVIHPRASVAKEVHLGRGLFIAANAVVNPGVKIGDGVIINTGAVVDHDCILGSWCHIAPGAVLLGRVEIGIGAMIGANAVIRQGLRVGEWSTVGCGAAVVKEIPPGEVWAGVPARKLSPQEG